MGNGTSCRDTNCHICERDIFEWRPRYATGSKWTSSPTMCTGRLRYLNPSLHMFYLKFGETAVCDSRPNGDQVCRRQRDAETERRDEAEGRHPGEGANVMSAS